LLLAKCSPPPPSYMQALTDRKLMWCFDLCLKLSWILKCNFWNKKWQTVWASMQLFVIKHKVCNFMIAFVDCTSSRVSLPVIYLRKSNCLAGSYRWKLWGRMLVTTCMSILSQRWKWNQLKKHLKHSTRDKKENEWQSQPWILNPVEAIQFSPSDWCRFVFV